MPYLLTYFSGPITVRVIDTFVEKNHILGDKRYYTLKVMRDCAGYHKGEILQEEGYKIYDKYRCRKNTMKTIYTGKNWAKKQIKERG